MAQFSSGHLVSLSRSRRSAGSRLVSRLSEQLEKELLEFTRGTRRTFSIPLHPKGTAFQRKIWAALLNIPYGHTASYQEIARQIGKPKASRAVGSACGANPIPILIPCHRVLAKKGIGGFSLGLKLKQKLLNLEAVKSS